MVEGSGELNPRLRAKPCNEDKARVVHGSDEPANWVKIADIFSRGGSGHEFVI